MLCSILRMLTYDFLVCCKRIRKLVSRLDDVFCRKLRSVGKGNGLVSAGVLTREGTNDKSIIECFHGHLVNNGRVALPL